MKKILVPIDGSEFSKRAVYTAGDLARKYDAEIEVLNVTLDPLNGFGQAYTSFIPPEQIERAGDRVLEETLKDVDFTEVALTKKKIMGDPANIIVREIERENIDLVVMGSQGYGAITGSLLGSVSQKVTHRAKCSVLIVK